VRNTGNASITISQLTASPGVFTLEKGPSLPRQLTSGASFTVDIRFMPTADGDVEGVLTVTPQSGNALKVNLRGPARVAAVSVVPELGDFGTVCQGQKVVQRFTLTSTGSADVSVMRPVLDGGSGAFSLTMVDPLANAYPTMLAPRETVMVDVKAAPTTETAMGTLRFPNDAPGDGAKVDLSVASIASGIAVSPGTLDFGAIAADDRSEPVAVGLSNCSMAPLQVVDLDITGSDASAFDVGGTVPPPSIIIPVGGQMRWVVVFAPTHGGSHRASLDIVHGSGTLTVPLSGEGRTDGPDASPDKVPDTPPDGGLEATSYYACSCRTNGDLQGGLLSMAVLAALSRRRTRTLVTKQGR